MTGARVQRAFDGSQLQLIGDDGRAFSRLALMHMSEAFKGSRRRLSASLLARCYNPSRWDGGRGRKE